ncbi:Tap42 interacting protein [Vermiconidia calcicola]|uniref:Tap42 interacting protein n=1 Tax=Vermiconidia calcicola TaxID=1690605 RepID=A0ACC3MJW9_9PEZI|nr:Tap42 interacting protein [Vermiconidia calcicola]
MAANGTSAENGRGVQSCMSRDGMWKVTSRKLPILKAGPIEELHERIGIPIPEMIFGDNHVSISHVKSGWTITFHAEDAMDRVSKTEEGMLQVAVAEEWKKQRSNQEEVKQFVKPFDWSYSTDYKGTTEKGSSNVDLYEDELADNGIALLSIKVRVMPERLLLLCRFFLRLDGVLIRIRDTRVYIEHSTGTVIRQYTAKEEKYEAVQEKLRGMRDNVAEAFRDANKLAPLLRTLEDRTDVFEVG